MNKRIYNYCNFGDKTLVQLHCYLLDSGKEIRVKDSWHDWL